jgi:hypothetical protein
VLPLAPHQVVAATPRPTRIRVTLTDSSVLVLKEPVAASDSVAGKSAGMRMAVPTDRIARTEVHDWRSDEPLSSWRKQRRTPQQVIATKYPERIRLTLTDSSELVLEYPMILGDSIIGVVNGSINAVDAARIIRTDIREMNSLKVMAFISVYAVLYMALCRNGADCPSRE